MTLLIDVIEWAMTAWVCLFVLNLLAGFFVWRCVRCRQRLPVFSMDDKYIGSFLLPHVVCGDCISKQFARDRQQLRDIRAKDGRP